MEIKTLSKVSNEKILEVFNASFSDYSIPLQLSIEQLNAKINNEDINKDVSVGAFENGGLIGFILHGRRQIGETIVCYNGGTGVIPSSRGNGLTRKMYAYIVPKMQVSNVQGVILEVISDNKPAIESYKKVGFIKRRGLNCYKGEIKGLEILYDIQELSDFDLNSINSFCNVEPTWQNSNATIKKLGSMVVIVGAYKEKVLVGYAALNKTNNRIMQIAVDKEIRLEGVASSLLGSIKINYSKAASIINVDANSLEVNSFLLKSGLKNYLTQEEMFLHLNKYSS